MATTVGAGTTLTNGGGPDKPAASTGLPPIRAAVAVSEVICGA